MDAEEEALHKVDTLDATPWPCPRRRKLQNWRRRRELPRVSSSPSQAPVVSVTAPWQPLPLMTNSPHLRLHKV